MRLYKNGPINALKVSWIFLLYSKFIYGLS